MPDQPPPTPAAGPSMWDLVIADMHARDRLGRERYGVPVRAHNGRDALVDLSDELCDAVVYLRQHREELKDLAADLRYVRNHLPEGADAADLIDAMFEKYRGLQ